MLGSGRRHVSGGAYALEQIDGDEVRGKGHGLAVPAAKADGLEHPSLLAAKVKDGSEALLRDPLDLQLRADAAPVLVHVQVSVALGDRLVHFLLLLDVLDVPEEALAGAVAALEGLDILNLLERLRDAPELHRAHKPPVHLEVRREAPSAVDEDLGGVLSLPSLLLVVQEAPEHVRDVGDAGDLGRGQQGDVVRIPDEVERVLGVHHQGVPHDVADLLLEDLGVPDVPDEQVGVVVVVEHARGGHHGELVQLVLLVRVGGHQAGEQLDLVGSGFRERRPELEHAHAGLGALERGRGVPHGDALVEHVILADVRHAGLELRGVGAGQLHEHRRLLLAAHAREVLRVHEHAPLDQGGGDQRPRPEGLPVDLRDEQLQAAHVADLQLELFRAPAIDGEVVPDELLRVGKEERIAEVEHGAVRPRAGAHGDVDEAPRPHTGQAHDVPAVVGRGDMLLGLVRGVSSDPPDDHAGNLHSLHHGGEQHSELIGACFPRSEDRGSLLLNLLPVKPLSLGHGVVGGNALDEVADPPGGAADEVQPFEFCFQLFHDLRGGEPHLVLGHLDGELVLLRLGLVLRFPIENRRSKEPAVVAVGLWDEKVVSFLGLDLFPGLFLPPECPYGLAEAP
mmetsp:Transcript_14512/g.29306  ORF Transcript_14512/g.29306 Transcript_14512/m.29306 type:complete len:622 (-) Transcript_14512:957-2822(-)|eukprot:CAMPEP_0167814076 /NCGR_PEP_ID=MMETSP0112_2-20121227/2213_1 /TAXON_ID=91324 /ORGANISM="Lotharella globosa, Strain CCCM811" /LENGTH=621 /DNA_ID=CAMNT_0007713239 /DNA_START=246 /DNA_END=2111 /DNA_ORIENTATION=+